MFPLTKGAGKSTEGRNLVFFYFFYEANQQTHQELSIWKNTKASENPQHFMIVAIKATNSSQNEHRIFCKTVITPRKEHKLERSSPLGLFLSFLK